MYKLIGRIIRRIPNAFRRAFFPKQFLEYQVFNSIKSTGFVPKVVFDIGAHKGDWTRSCSRHFPDASFHLFEPQQDLLESFQLKTVDLKKNFIGVSSHEGIVPMYEHDRRDSFSLKDISKRGRVYKDIPVESIDSYSSKNNISQIDILKIDGEGTDLEILQGAKRMLSSVTIIFVEAGLVNPKFENTVPNLINVLKDFSFEIFDISDLNRSPFSAHLWNVELVFINKNKLKGPFAYRK